MANFGKILEWSYVVIVVLCTEFKSKSFRSWANSCIVAFDGGLGWPTSQVTPEARVRSSKVRGSGRRGVKRHHKSNLLSVFPRRPNELAGRQRTD